MTQGHLGNNLGGFALWEINDLRDQLKELLVNMIITASEPICLSSHGSEKGVWKKMVRL